ncbi:MAG: hypothetical protein R2769_15660 [Saprospiraceae bacterium]
MKFTKREMLSSNRFFCLQDTYTWRKDSVSEIKLSAGLRAFYWTLNNEIQVTPRAQLLYKNLRSGKDVTYKLASGLYYQPPFYRELEILRES